jgi:hypothetical protein
VTPDRQKLRTWVAGALLAGAIIALFFSPLLDPDTVAVSRDLPFLHLPLRTTFAELATDRLPQWNPRIHGGQPVLSNPHYAAFYPVTWLALVLPAHVAINLTILLHLALAFAGAWRLAARLGCRPAACALAAVAYAGSGTYVSLAGLLLLFTGMAWFPWLLAWADETLRPAAGAGGVRAPLLLALGLALQILNGDPASVVLTGLGLLALGAEALARRPPAAEPGGRLRRLRRLAAALGLGGLLASVQILPTLSRLGETARGEGLDLERATVWSAPPLRLVDAIFPRAYGDSMRDEESLYFGWRLHDRQYPFITSLYVGLLPWVLAISTLAAGRLPYRASWIVLVAAGLALALGRHNPLYGLLHGALPFVGAMRYPEKFLLLSVLVLPFPAACGFERLLAARAERGDGRGRAAPLLAAAVLAVASVWAASAAAWPERLASFVRANSGMTPSPATVAAGVEYLRGQAQLAVAVSGAVLAWLLLARGRRLSQGALVASALVLVLGDLWLYGRRLNQVMTAEEFFRPPGLAQEAGAAGGRLFTDTAFFSGPTLGARIGPPGFQQLLALLQRLHPYSATLWRLEYALHEDFDIMMTYWARLPLAALHADWTDGERRLRLLGAWHAAQLLHVLQPEELLSEFARTGAPPAPARLERNPHLLPRWRFVGAAVFHPDKVEALRAARLQDYALAEREHLVTPGAGDAGGERRFAAASLGETAEAGDRIRVRYRSPGPALLVGAVTYDVGWSAAVDGRPVSLVPTAIGQLAAELPAGEHALELRFRDPWVAVGASASTTGLLLVLLVLLRARRSAAPAAA